MTVSDKPAIEQYIQAIFGMKALDVVALDVRDLASFADAFIICSGRSHRQVTAIAQFVEQDLKKKGIKPVGVEGLGQGHWVLMDYGDVVIHVFYEPIRMFYDLEGLWSDAKRIEIKGGEKRVHT
jgi:ribosome-associated protein